MKIKQMEITVPGQVTGSVSLKGYLLDCISVAPEKTRPAIIICPGGGYGMKSDREAEPIVTQFLAMGYHAFVLDYSVDPNRFPVAVRELGEAVGLLRVQSTEWHIDSQKIIVCGFSAGGHLACSLGVFWNNPDIYESIGRTTQQIRPNGMILCYPVITSGEYRHVNSFKRLLGKDCTQEEREKVSLENFVTELTPKAFIWHTITDIAVPVENSLLLATAMSKQKVNFELHIYPVGGHGLSLAKKETAGENAEKIESQCQSWIRLLETWLENL